jgi:hypothetical protein
MCIIPQQLHELDTLYRTAPLANYESALQAAVMQVQQAFQALLLPVLRSTAQGASARHMAACVTCSCQSRIECFW